MSDLPPADEPPREPAPLDARPVHDPFFPGARPRRRREHSTVPAWVRTGLVLLSAFVLWLVMDAEVLQHNALVNSPLGTRRAVALDLLGPLADVGRWTHLAWFESEANVALGRTGDGGFVVPTVPTTTTVPGTTTTTTTIPFHPTPRHKLRILLIGDSIGEDLDLPLWQDLVGTGVTVVWTDDHVDTGLVRPDYFPWLSELRLDMYRYRPQIVIGMMGANDDQGFLDGVGYGTRAWDRKYAQAVGQFFSVGTQGGTKMFWVSVPQMSTPGWGPVRVVQHQVAVQHRLYYVDSDLTLCPGGRFRMFLRVNGTLEQIRTGDGIHLEPAGSALLAQNVLNIMERDLRLRLR